MDDLDPTPEISLEIVYADEHLLELEAIVRNGLWRGQAKAYTLPRDIATFATSLERFADGAVATAAFQAGDDTGIGLISLRFYRIDRAGHIACHTTLVTNDYSTDHRPEEEWRLAVEAGAESWAVLQFARQLTCVASAEAGRASLAIAPVAIS